MSLFSDPATTSKDEPPMVPGDSSLPIDLIGEILARLPVKSILRFKCACKAWNALIIDPQFIKKHYRTTDPSRHRVLVASVESLKIDNLAHYSLRSTSSSPPTHSKVDLPVEGHSKVDLPFEGHFFDPCVNPLVGKCHGMLCFEFFSDLILLNPSARKFKELPLQPSIEYPKHDFKGFGFGYDHISDSYKVVKVFYSYFYGVRDEIVGAIHTLGTYSWRRFNQKFYTPIPRDNYGRFVSGTLNWLSLYNKMEAILSLDLGTETFQLLWLPDCLTGFDRRGLAIGVLKDRLCIVDRSCRSFDVWVMKDYGNKESWTKLLTVPSIKEHPEFIFSIPRGFWISEKDVHNFKSGTSKSDRINPRSYFVLVYAESLISPSFHDWTSWSARLPETDFLLTYF